MSAMLRSIFRSQNGSTMIEVLVTIVIISFGLLGVAALQVTGLKNNKSAVDRSQASVMAYDLIDRMRVNRKQTKDGNYNTGTTLISWNGSAIAGGVTFSGMADKDVTDWITTVSKRLPEGKATIEAAANATVIRITIQWDDSRGSGGGSTQTLSVETQGCGADASCYL